MSRRVPLGHRGITAAKDRLAERGFDPVYGARPLKRVIQGAVGTALAQQLIRGTTHDGERIAVDVGPSGVTFRSAGSGAGEHAGTAAR